MRSAWPGRVKPANTNPASIGIGVRAYGTEPGALVPAPATTLAATGVMPPTSASGLSDERHHAGRSFQVLGQCQCVVPSQGLEPVSLCGGAQTHGSITDAGVVYQTNAVPMQALADAVTANNILMGQAATSDVTGTNLGDMTLTLDALDDPDALFIFQIGSTLTTASGSAVHMVRGEANEGIYWQVGSSATLGSSTVFVGNILADQSITLDTTAKILCGRAIALHAAVTMDTNTLSDDCFGSGAIDSGRTDFGSHGFSGFGADAAKLRCGNRACRGAPAPAQRSVKPPSTASVWPTM